MKERAFNNLAPECVWCGKPFNPLRWHGLWYVRGAGIRNQAFCDDDCFNLWAAKHVAEREKRVADFLAKRNGGSHA